MLASGSCDGKSARRNAVGDEGAQSPGRPVSRIDTNIRAIFQDSKGRYWFGSDGRGAYCFDGKTIRHFDETTGLAGDRVRQIQEDAGGAIFINTLSGISRLTDSSIGTIPLAKATQQPGAWKIGKNDLLFVTPQELGGIFRYDGRQLTHLDLPKSPLEDAHNASNPKVPFSLYGVYTIYKDQRGNIWFGTSTFGACRFDGAHCAWLYERALSEIPGGGSLGIRGIVEDDSGRLFISNNRQLFEIPQQDSVAGPYRHLRYRKVPGPGAASDKDFTYFQGILRDGEGNFWMTTYGDGIWKYDGNAMQHIPVKDGDRNALIVTIAKDRSGKILLGTENAGVYRFDGSRFEPFFQDN